MNNCNSALKLTQTLSVSRLVKWHLAENLIKEVVQNYHTAKMTCIKHKQSTHRKTSRKIQTTHQKNKLKKQHWHKTVQWKRHKFTLRKKNQTNCLLFFLADTRCLVRNLNVSTHVRRARGAIRYWPGRNAFPPRIMNTGADRTEWTIF